MTSYRKKLIEVAIPLQAIIDAATRYGCRPFATEPDFKATSVNYDLAALLAQAQEPA